MQKSDILEDTNFFVYGWSDAVVQQWRNIHVKRLRSADMVQH